MSRKSLLILSLKRLSSRDGPFIMLVKTWWCGIFGKFLVSIALHFEISNFTDILDLQPATFSQTPQKSTSEGPRREGNEASAFGG